MEEKEKSTPIEVIWLQQILKKNGMLPVSDETFKRGRSVDNPIVIGIEDGYVHSEYIVADFIFDVCHFPHRFEHQNLIEHNDRMIDELVYSAVGPDNDVRKVSFFFDITEGYNSYPTHSKLE